jgi:hypothetical protein
MQSMYSVNREAWGHKWGSSVAVVSQRDGRACNPITHDEAMANASLISAAPDLLEALEAVVEWLEQGDHEGKLHTMATAAIAKAKGQA